MRHETNGLKEAMMEDIVAIQQLLNQYSISSSRHDIEGVVATYTTDGVWRIASRDMTFEGKDSIREGLVGLTAAQEFIMQHNAPAMIEIDGDTASATSMVCERGKIAGNSEGFEALGFYDDKLVRTTDGWRFKSRCFQLVNMRRLSTTDS
jgi:ketosteroid isomerase-like protein